MDREFGAEEALEFVRADELLAVQGRLRQGHEEVGTGRPAASAVAASRRADDLECPLQPPALVVRQHEPVLARARDATAI